MLVGARVPHPGEQAAPPCVSVQATPVLGVPVTVAINVWACPTGTLAVVGATVTVMGRVIEVVVPQPIRYASRLNPVNNSNIRRMKNLAAGWDGMVVKRSQVPKSER